MLLWDGLWSFSFSARFLHEIGHNWEASPCRRSFCEPGLAYGEMLETDVAILAQATICSIPRNQVLSYVGSVMDRPAPIDVDATDDEDDHGNGDGPCGSPIALVPVGNNSPVKRAKVSSVLSHAPLESQQLVTLIQSTNS